VVIFRSTDSLTGFQRIDTINGQHFDDTVLIANVYYYRLTSINGAGKESPFSSIPPGARRLVPSAPDSVSASKGLYTDTIRVTFRSSAGADGYRIYRSTDSAVATVVLRGTTGKNVLVWNDTVHTDSLFYYSVKAFNGGGESVLSRAHGSGFRKPEQAPGVPMNLAATKNNALAVVLTWQPPVSGCQPLQYRIYRSATQTGTYSSVAITVERTYQDPVPATFPTTYWYKIAGVNNIGEGAQCGAVEGYRN